MPSVNRSLVFRGINGKSAAWAEKPASEFPSAMLLDLLRWQTTK